MFNSINAFRRREIRLQTRNRAIVSIVLQSNIILSNNLFMFFFINRIIKLFDNVQFENFNENNDFVDFDDVDVLIKHISIFEFLISNVN